MRARIGIGLFGLLLAAACGTFEAGFANAPSINRQHPPVAPHDVIANGPESCGGTDAGGPPCAGAGQAQPAAR